MRGHRAIRKSERGSDAEPDRHLPNLIVFAPASDVGAEDRIPVA
jgi:hypothetical protein